MNRLSLIIIVALFFSCVQAWGSRTLPIPQTFSLKNGMKVYFLSDATLPMVAFRMVLPEAGSLTETQEGLASLTAELITKGTPEKSAEEIAAEIDFLGASLSFSAASEFLEVSGRSLSENFPALFQLAIASLTAPTFPQAELDKERNIRLERLKSIKDNPSSAVNFYFRKAYFGNHPLGAISLGNESALKGFQRQQVVDFYSSHYRPDSALLAVTGNISIRTLKSLLENRLSKWANPVQSLQPLRFIPIPLPAGKKCLLIDKSDASQAYFVLGVPGIKKADPETASSQVFNTLFGGRFTSWLNSELRIKRGLTYGARSSFQSWRNDGIFTISSYTKNDQIGEMLKIVFELIVKAKKDGFDQDEIISARNYILGQFPPTLEDMESKVRAYTELTFYGESFDYYDHLLSRVSSTDQSSARSLASRILPKEKYVLVVVGKADEILKRLEPFGIWEVKKISDPGFH